MVESQFEIVDCVPTEIALQLLNAIAVNQYNQRDILGSKINDISQKNNLLFAVLCEIYLICYYNLNGCN